MQAININYYSQLDDSSRKPCCRAYCKKAGESIPFAGKSIEVSTVNETNPKTIYHSTGRTILVYSKVVTGYTQIHFRRTNTTRTLWESEVVLTTGNTNKSYPDIVEIVGGNIGIVYVLGGIIYQITVDVDGAIVSAATSTTYTAEHPSLEYVTASTKYWLAYEVSGVLKYRTADVFGTWSAENSFVTGLANNHDFPLIYKDNSAKLWLVFQRVSDPAASPVVDNVYYMTSTDNGSTWSVSTAITSFVAGEGSAKHPSIVDTGGTYRYFSYFYEQLIQNNQDTHGADYNHSFFISDDTNDRVGMITGNTYAGGQYLCIYDKSAGTYTNHDLTAHGLTSGAVTCLAYDVTNKIWVIGTSADGLIVYDEINVTWATYSTGSTPAILADNIPNQIMSVEDNKIYFVSYSLAGYNLQKLDLTAGINTLLKALTWPTALYQLNIFLSTSYVICIVRASTAGAYNISHPTIHVINKTTDTELYNTKMSDGSQYNCTPSMDTAGNVNYRYAQLAWDEVNNVIYALATDTNETDDSGIIKYVVGNSALTFSKYYSQLDSNPTGLLPNPDQSTGKISFINNLVFNSTNNRLYIESYTTPNIAGGVDENQVSIMSTITDTVLEIYANTNSTIFSTYWAVIDAGLIKVLPVKTRTFIFTTSIIAATDDKEFIFYTDTGSPPDRYFWHSLTTEGVTGGMYYRKTSDDITWTTAAILTTEGVDNYLHLDYTNTMMVFFQRTVDGITLLRYDIDLSAEINISEYVASVEINKTADSSADTATVEIADTTGLFDQLNYNSLWSSYFEEDNIIRIEKGYSGYYYPAFYGYISGGRSGRNRGSPSKYTINLINRAKNFYKNKITTSFYEGQTIEYIATDIATTYMGFAAGEYEIPAITQTIATVQFIEEYPMDILEKLFQVAFYFPYIDEENKLKARQINQDAAVDFTYFQTGTDVVGANKAPSFNIVDINYEWNDEAITNRVKVIGETEATTETEFDEEPMGMIRGTAGWFSNKNQFDFYYSGDKGMYCANPRLEIIDSVGNSFFGGGEGVAAPGVGKQNYCTITQNISNTVNIIMKLASAAAVLTMLYGFFVGTGSGTCWVVNTLAPVVFMITTFLGQISSYDYRIHAEPVGDAIPDTIEAIISDAVLIKKNGTTIETVIDNPFLNTYALCYAVAEYELAKAKWFVKQPQVTVIANQAHQVGDIISAYYKTTNNTYKLYVRGITQRFSRGQPDKDLLDCALIS